MVVWVSSPGRGWESFEALAGVSRGGSATVCRAQPRAARAPPVGRGSAAVESVWDAWQAVRSVSVCTQLHASSPQQGLFSSQVSWNFIQNQNHFFWEVMNQTFFCYFKIMEDRLAQGCLLPGICVYRDWGLSSSWRCTSYSAGVQLPTGALRFREVQTDPHQQSGHEVSLVSILNTCDFISKLLEWLWCLNVEQICIFDFRGRTPDWYNKAFGHLCAAEAARIRNSFQPLITDGPETKIWLYLTICGG